MNALVLVAAAGVAFVFGYRYYAKLLALDVFRLDHDYSTPAQARADGRDFVPTHPQLLFGHHLAATTGAAAFAAPLVALGWGWIPAFLWITVGSAVAAGTYGIGSFWLAARHPGNPAEAAARFLGRHSRAALLGLMLLVLLILIAAAAGFAALLLARFPGAALPLAAIALVALALGSYLHGRAQSELLPACTLAFVAALFAVWVLGHAPLVLDGALVIALGGLRFALDGVVAWTVLLLVYALHAARLAVWKLMRPRAFLTALLLALLLALFYAALVIAHPPLAAPQFHAYPSAPSALPRLFLLIGVGALAGWQLLIVHGVTGRELRRETEARAIGYGTAVVQGLVALGALVLGATAFGTEADWLRHYAAAPGLGDLPAAAAFYIDALVRQLDTLGLDPVSARSLAATVLAGLALAVLEGGVRTLGHLLREAFPAPAETRSARDPARRRLRLLVAVAGLVALHDGRGLGGLALWPLLALASLWLAAAGFALMAAALRHAGRPPLLCAALAAATCLVAAWAAVAQVREWWQAGAWLALAAGLAIVLCALLWLREALRFAWAEARRA